MLTQRDIQTLIERFGGQPVTTRTLAINNRADRAEPITAVLTTEMPAQVFSWERWDVITEVMLADGMVLPTNRDKVPLLDSHSRWSIKEHLGSVANFGNVTVSDYLGKTGELSFSSVPDSQEAKTKVDEGHVTDVSAGYEVLKAIWIPPNTKQLINGKEYDGGKDGLQVTTQWKLKEVSLCPIGADELATIRSEARQMKRTEDETDCPECGMKTPADGTYCKSCGKEIKRAAQSPPDPKPTITQQSRGDVSMEPTKEQLTDQERAAIREAEMQRIRDIDDWKRRTTGRVENVDELASTAIKDNWSIDQFKGALAEKLAAKGEPLAAPTSALGLTGKEQKRYSLARAIAYQCKQRGVAEFASKDIDATFEIEASNEIAKQAGISPRGMFVPYEVQPGKVFQRDQTVGSATGGGNLVGTNLIASQFIDLPRNMFLADKIGVQRLGGLVGNVAIPKQTAAGTAEWVAESNAATETAITVGQVTLTPKTVTAWYDYSRKLLLQSTPGIDALINADGEKILLLAVDKAIFHGGGTNEPVGIVGTSGVGDVVAAGMNWEKAIEFRTDVAVGNSLGQNMAFVTDPVTAGVLMTRPKEAGFPMYLMENGRVAGYPLYDSNQITAGYIFFGDGSTVVLGEFGTLDVLVDPYTASTTGVVRTVFFKSVDVGVRLASAWSMADDAS